MLTFNASKSLLDLVFCIALPLPPPLVSFEDPIRPEPIRPRPEIKIRFVPRANGSSDVGAPMARQER